MFDNELYLRELASDYLAHVGVAHDANPPGRGSGRYEYGSGEHAFQHEAWYGKRQLLDKLKAEGMNEKQIMEYLNMSSSEYRRMVSITKEQREAAYYSYAIDAMNNRGMSLNATAKELGISEATLRGMVKRYNDANSQKISKTADVLRDCLKDTPYLDVGSGTAAFLTGNSEMNVSDETIKSAIQLLNAEGYSTTEIKVEQLGTQNGQYTTIKVLCPNPDGKSSKELASDIYKNHIGDITPVSAHFEEINGETKLYNWEYPSSVDSKRVKIVYAEDGGTDRDGVIEIRRGCEDLYLGDNVHYAQVRIGVDGTHYLKGMAVYSDDLPEGCDIRFNTNKKAGTPMLGEDNNHSVLKLMKTDDPNNPFGSALRQKDAQRHYIDEDGNEQLSPINKCKQEGDWDEQRLSLPSQFLSKQPVPLAKQQLETNYENLKAEYDAVMALTNPVVRKSQLLELAEKCDAEAVDLRGAAMPGQKTKVLLPSPSLKEGECYLPDFEDGARVCLIRYPHANVAEIPVLINNTKNKEAKKMIGDGVDAIGVNPSTASQLSGADYDGDTCTVIRDEDHKIITAKPIQQLVDFEPKRDYAAYDGMTPVGPKKKLIKVGTDSETGKDVYKNGDGFNTQIQMGTITNLIADMQLFGASTKDQDLINATKYSMVVIDAEKHQLNWKQAYKDLNISAISKKWREGEGGAASLITRASSEERVPQRKLWTASKKSIDPETGEKIYEETEGARYTDKNGVEKVKTTKSTKGAEWSLEQLYSSKGPNSMEAIYGDYMQSCKDLGNKCRLNWLNTPKQEYNPSAAKAYSNEVASLTEKLRVAQSNSPRERQAQAVANADRKAILAENPEKKNDKDFMKKLNNTLLTNARLSTGAHKDRINPTDKEWEAIQAGAITDNMLTNILSNSNKERITELARPRNTNTLTSAQQTRIKTLKNNGYTIAEIADFMGVSSSTVSKVITPNANG